MTRTMEIESCICKEDCESTLTMRIRCRRGHLLTAIPILVLLFFYTNMLLVSRYLDDMRDYDDDSFLDGNRTFNMQREARKAQRRRRPRNVPPPVPPRPESLSANATFSACLLIRDDNAILSEWLAYHTHVLRLRHLIVAVDPLSTESPSAILQRWRLMYGLKISEWKDEDYMPKDFVEKGHPPDLYMQKASDFTEELSKEALLEISNHRYRQRVFLAKCMKRFRDQGLSWVMHIDTDEFMTPSKLLRQMNPSYLELQDMSVPGSVLSLVQQTVEKSYPLVSYPCISMLRLLFGAVESAPHERETGVPEGFDPIKFETLRWRYHALPHNMSLHGNPKVIVDVSAIPDTYFPKDVVYSIHRPVEAYCQKNKELSFTNFRKQPIAVNHYLGSWERYNGRNDKRRSRAIYDAKAQVSRGKDDGVRTWLQGFVNDVGYSVASKLLGKEYLRTQMSNSSVAQQ